MDCRDPCARACCQRERPYGNSRKLDTPTLPTCYGRITIGTVSDTLCRDQYSSAVGGTLRAKTMSEYVLGILGIAVSVGLFLLGYRQTIGAKKERVRAGNSEIEKILVRRIVLEGYTPSASDIGRIIDGKARDFRVHPPDLLSESQLLNNIFTRVIETDFIPRDQREEVLDRLFRVMAQAEDQPISDRAGEDFESPARSSRIATIAMALMGTVASIIGGTFAALPEIREVDSKTTELVGLAVGTAVVSLTIIVFMISLYRIRERQQEEPSKAVAISEYMDFENNVVKALTQAGVEVQFAGPHDQGFDLIVEHKGRRILVELRGWKRSVSPRMVGMVLNRLAEALPYAEGSEGVLVTRGYVPDRGTFPIPERVQIMNLREFRKYLSLAAQREVHNSSNSG